MHPNAAWLLEQDKKLEAGDLEAYFAGYTEDVVLHVAGSSSIGGTVAGKEAMMRVYERFNELLGDVSFDTHAVVADDDHGVLLATMKASKDGITFEGTETVIVHFSGGQINEIWIDFEDRYAFDAYLG